MKQKLTYIASLTLFLLSNLTISLSLKAEDFQSNEAALSYEVSGKGTPIFLLHGGLASREDLRAQINHLAQYFLVVALDSREHGFSSNSPLQISYKLMASDVLNLADHLDLKRFSIMGQSDGGITALTVASENPSRVDRLVLLGTSYNHSVLDEATKDYLKNVKWPKEMDPNSFPGMYFDDYLKGGRNPSLYQNWYDEMATMWLTSPNFSVNDLSKILSPTLVVNGDHHDVALGHILSLYEALPNAQLFIVPGGSHFLHIEKPTLLNNTVLAFLRGETK